MEGMMAVTLPGTERGRTRAMGAELNLVPFIDLLSVCITFLLLTAVWTQVEAMPIEQAVGEPPTEPAESEPPLTVHLRVDGLWLGREPSSGTTLPKAGAGYDWSGLRGVMQADRALHADARDAVLVTDDGVEYQDMIRALDATRTAGYVRTRLGGATE
jgi:biopolymer transport protein ExbD